MASDQSGGDDSSKNALSGVLVVLLKRVLYQEADARRWGQLLNLQAQLRDYVGVLGLELMLDEAEGYAFLRSRTDEDVATDGENTGDSVPRLMARRQLSFPVSLLLALLRKKLAESDAGGGETRLILTRDDIVEMIRVFLPDGSNEARLVDQVDRHINKVLELGFLGRLKSTGNKQQARFEVRRIIKAFVDAQWLSELDQKLEHYKAHAAEERGDGND